MKGKIVKGIAGFYYVDVVGSGVYECKAKGVFRKEKRKPLVGDNVEIEVLDEKDMEGNITEILPRKNELIRPAVANVDQALVVFAVAKPDPHFHLLDRFLVMMERKEIPVILCFNKDDLGTEEKIGELRDIYRDCGCLPEWESQHLSIFCSRRPIWRQDLSAQKLNGESILRDIRNYSHWEIIRTLWIRQGSVPCTWKILKRKI